VKTTRIKHNMGIKYSGQLKFADKSRTGKSLAETATFKTIILTTVTPTALKLTGNHMHTRLKQRLKK